MKRKVIIICVLTLIVATFFGCGKANESSKNDGSQSTNSKTVEENDGSQNTNSEAVEENDGSQSTNSKAVEEFVKESNEIMAVIMESTKDTMEAYVTAENDKVVYSYKFLQELGDEDAVKTAMDNAKSSQEDAMNMALDELRSLGVENPVIELKFINMDGKEVAVYEFK